MAPNPTTSRKEREIKMKISEMFPRKYTTVEDLAGKPVSLTISTVRREQLHSQSGSPAAEKFVLYFQHAGKGVILNPTLARLARYKEHAETMQQVKHLDKYLSSIERQLATIKRDLKTL
jgi:hypothetical protein